MSEDVSAIGNHLLILRKRGFRITPIVVAVLNELSQSSKVRTANELRGDISQSLGYAVGNPTVYRICERLASSGVLCTMHASDGIMRYFLCNLPQDDQHHHFICRRCQRVQEVQCDIDEKIRAVITKSLHGVVEKNFIQIEGVCRECNR